MKFYCSPVVIICLLLTILSSPSIKFAAPENISLPGCPSTCGNLSIPYPFGIGTNCARKGFQLSCNHSFIPPKAFIDTSTLQVFNISLLGAQAKVGYYRGYDCYAKDGSHNVYNTPKGWAGEGDSWPYTFSNVHNKFTVLGCDTYAYMYGYDETGIRAGCDTKCNRWEQVVNGSCDSLGCCQVSIPKGLKYFKISVNSWDNHTNVWDFNPCGYAFLVDQESFTFNAVDITKKSKYRYEMEQVPLVLDWVAGNESCTVAMRNQSSYACRSDHSVCYNATSSATGYLCNCSSGYEGNPYLVGGCQDLDECQRPKEYPCYGICTNIQGGYICSCPKASRGDPKLYACIKEKKPLVIILAIVVPVLIGAILIICIYGHYEKRKRSKLAQQFYKQNGGVILEKHMSTHQHLQSMLKVFTKEDLEKATNKFDENKLLGRGGQGMVYEGILPDKTKVAIKRSIKLSRDGIDDFINEIIILSQINHKNIVRLLGCCLEVEIPYLVYEFVPNKTLYHHIHKNKPINWSTRLRIAADTARALEYMHTKLAITIYHRDVKSENILLDATYTAKVSDFGVSKLVPTDKNTLNTMVQGTFGYLDPEYFDTQQLSDKSDVYSFGVVLAELLTGREPILSHSREEERCLAKYLKTCIEQNRLIDILDPEILISASGTIINQMTDVANLVGKCLKLNGLERPDMREVSFELEGLCRSKIGEAQEYDETENLLGEHGLNVQYEHQSIYSSTSGNGYNTASFSIDVGR